MGILKSKLGHLILILVHMGVGAMLKYYPYGVALFYVLAFCLAAIDVAVNSDRNNRAGFYALYLMGLEMAYRMAGAPLAWELGKYLSILILVVGMLFGQRKYIAWIFLFLLCLLIPSIFLIENSDPERVRKMILFNLSGPLSLVFAGFYFYKRPVLDDDLFDQLKIAFLPAFTIVVGLSLIASISMLEFTSVQSNVSASGGFGANQVSTVLGWFILLALLYKINGKNVTMWGWLDWGMLFMLFLRALLTFSRGGVLGALLALLGSVIVYFVSVKSFRIKTIKALPYLLLGIGFFVMVFFIANNLTNNFLLYRYEGKTTNEVLSGESTGEHSLLTGRYELMEGEFQAFTEYPMFGVGVGMGEKYRERFYGMSVASHTEYLRLMAEHGILGVLFILVGMVILPISFFFSWKSPLSRSFFIAFLLLSLFTMFHGAMRLAVPGILFGAAFMCIYSKKGADV